MTGWSEYNRPMFSAGKKILLFILVFCFGMSWLVFPVRAAEQISLFTSEITVNRDTSITIQETIRYTTTEAKHGIYRYIPVRYSDHGLNYTAKIRDITVRDENGQAMPFSRSYDAGNVVLKIGDADVTFTGDKTYVLSYLVENAVNQVVDAETKQSFPQLYWDITGEGWQIAIASTSATVQSPHAAIKRVACYAGAYGADNGRCQAVQDTAQQASFTYTLPITYGDNVTVAIALDSDGQIIFPGRLQILGKQIRDNLGLLPLLLPGLVMFVWWWKKGRDRVFASWNVFNSDEKRPQHLAPLLLRRNIPLVYEPIQGLTPGEAGGILDEKVDLQDIIAEIIDLARLKCLSVERLEKKKLLGTETDYLLRKLPQTKVLLSTHQQYLLDHLFEGKAEVKLSNLKGKFYTHIDKLRQLIFQSLLEKKLFVSQPQTTRGWALAVAIMMSIILFGWCSYLANQGIWLAIPIYVISVLLALLLAYNLPAKTAKGYNYSQQAKGLRRTIQYGAWREKIKEKHLFIEEVLPFAVAFGVVNKLSQDMADLQLKPPDYLGTSTLNGWTTASFVRSFTANATATLAYNPSSSSRSSGSGFSGGFSGGGGGGGGGGSW